MMDLQQLLRSLEPVLQAGEYLFAILPSAGTLDLAHAVAFVREPEGLSVVLEASVARAHGIESQARFAWITLSVHSDLQAVGLTGAFASALGLADISCNVVAGTNHDHIFVPVEQAGTAMAVLRKLQQAAASAAIGGG